MLFQFFPYNIYILYFMIFDTMMWALKVLMKRPTDKTIRIVGTLFGLIYILATGYNFIYQPNSLENNFFGYIFDESNMQIVSYIIVGLWLIPLFRWITGIPLASRWYVRIFQIRIKTFHLIACIYFAMSSCKTHFCMSNKNHFFILKTRATIFTSIFVA